MENLIELISTLSKNKNSSNNSTPAPIPKEILDQYPYGEFPIRYTKVGQEDIRKHSEKRFAYTDEPKKNIDNNSSNTFDLKSLMPIIQLLSNKNHSSKDMFKIFSQLLFKDNPELTNILELFSKETNIHKKELDNRDEFPNTNKVSISSLKKIK